MLIHNDSSFHTDADLGQTSVFFVLDSTKVCTFCSNCDTIVSVYIKWFLKLVNELHNLLIERSHNLD